MSRARELRISHQRARERLADHGPELLRLLTRARSRVAVQSRGLSEQVEQLGQNLARVRTKVERLATARGDDLRIVDLELEDAWGALMASASRIRAVLEPPEEEQSRGR